MKPSVCALIFVNNLIVGVSRKHNLNSMGLPGGKIEENEQPHECLIRETKEETGLNVKHYHYLYANIDDHGNETTTYLCTVDENIDENYQFKTLETGKVKLCTWDDLFNGEFGKYNRELKQFYENINKVTI